MQKSEPRFALAGSDRSANGAKLLILRALASAPAGLGNAVVGADGLEPPTCAV